jgi:peptide/nickel transport system permease protein
VALVFLLLGITLVSFILTQMVPGNPALASLGLDATPEAIQAFDARYGLDQPLPVQYLRYLQHLIHGDLGYSQQTLNPVAHDLGVFIPATVELAVTSMIIAGVVGVVLGVFAALKRDGALDYVLRIVSLGGVSVPVFWLALIAIYVLYFKFGILPSGGRIDVSATPPPHLTGLYTVDAIAAGDWSLLPDILGHLILPALVLAAFNVSVLTRYTRSTVLEIIEQDYVRAARAQGLPERTIVVRYVLRAALPALVTLIALMFASVMTGAVLVENIFNWPGLGQYAYLAATSLDLPAIMGVTLFIALLYVTINFIVDVLYGVLDPRIRVSA